MRALTRAPRRALSSLTFGSSRNDAPAEAPPAAQLEGGPDARDGETAQSSPEVGRKVPVLGAGGRGPPRSRASSTLRPEIRSVETSA